MFLLFLIVITAQPYRFIYFLSNNQSFKHPDQICDDMLNIYKEFNLDLKKEEIFGDVQRFNVFQYRNNKELIASLFINLDTYYGMKNKNIISCPIMEIYSVFVDEKYRGKKIGPKLILESVKFLKNMYKLNDDTLVALHLNPKDKMMNVSYSIYIKMGFDKSSFVTNGPNFFQYKLEEIPNLIDPVVLVNNPSFSKYKGWFFAMYCPINNIHMPDSKTETGLLSEYGSKLRKILLDSSN
ncbi:putative acetyl-transferase [Hamiltosporidium tvaerminnensis]|uniref:Putative acetyl-transferase n=1 Tax=Hamiltosporidium tvaerminnensis TaxID=1176355 RepID=A0A4Q9M171_9MICR|nr:putative acetyl-transferase [Hamiltosporidium tvaerminnensis]